MRALPFGFLGPRGPSAQCEEGWGPPLRSALHPGLLLYDARGYAPLHSPRGGRSAPPTPGDFPVAGKVTKGAPRAVPFGIPPGFQQNFGNLTQSGSRDGAQALLDWKLQPSLTALFALAALRSGSRRATFCHKKRPICHFEFVSKSVFFLLKLHRESHFLLSIRGSVGGGAI